MKRTATQLAVRLWILAVVFAAGAKGVDALGDYVRARAGAAAEPLLAELATVPLALGKYRGEELEISESVQAILRDQDHIKRVYRSEDGDAFTIYAGYYSELGRARAHSAEVCYPGAGWQRTREEIVVIGEGQAHSVRVTVLIFTKGGRYQGVVNWFVLWGGPTADAHGARWRRLRDLMMRRRGIIKVQMAVALEVDGEIPVKRLEPAILRINRELERLLPEERPEDNGKSKL